MSSPRSHVVLVVLLVRVVLLAVAVALCLVLAPACKKTERVSSSDSDPDRSVVTPSREAETDANVRAALAREGCTITRQDGRLLQVRCGDDGEPSAINLENFDGLVQAVATAEERRARAFEFIHRLTSTASLPATAPLDKLLLVIRQQGYIEGSTHLMRGGDEPAKVVSFPFPGDLVVIAALDTPGNTAILTVPTVVGWKLDEATVYARAIENFDAHPLEPLRVAPEESTVTIYRLTKADDENEASRILSAKTRASLEKALGGRAFFAIPDRRQVLAARADDVRAVHAMRALTLEYSRGPLRISGDLFEVDGQGKLRVAK